MSNTVVLTMFREDFKQLIALAHKFKSEKVLASLPDVHVFSAKDDSVVHAVFPDTGTRRTHPLINFDDPTNLLDSVADVKDMICGENYLSVDDICSE